jgi:RecJ-like exonuclease
MNDKKEIIICESCNGAGYNPQSGEEQICHNCKGTGTLTRKKLKEITDREPEILKHSPTIDEWIESVQRQRGLIK